MKPASLDTKAKNYRASRPLDKDGYRSPQQAPANQI